MTGHHYRLGVAAVAASLGALGCLTAPRLPEPPRPGQLPDLAPSQPIVRQTQYQEPEQLPPPRQETRSNVVTLPQAIHESVYANLRLRARGEKVHQAMAELTTSSIIPNSQLFWDYQFIPL